MMLASAPNPCWRSSSCTFVENCAASAHIDSNSDRSFGLEIMARAISFEFVPHSPRFTFPFSVECSIKNRKMLHQSSGR